MSNKFPLEGDLLGNAKIVCSCCFSEYALVLAEIKQNFDQTSKALSMLSEENFGQVKHRKNLNKKLKAEFSPRQHRVNN